MSQLHRGEMLLIAGFAFALFLSSASTFHKYLGPYGVYLYTPTLLAAVALAWYVAPIVHRQISEKQAFALLILLLLGLALLFLVGYPIANSGSLGQGSDRDEAIQQATIRLIRGEYPYYVRTYLDNPISPLPGAALGRASYFSPPCFSGSAGKASQPTSQESITDQHESKNPLHSSSQFASVCSVVIISSANLFVT